MTESYKKLIATLEEIFQLDQADLDFGIYRIMNQKRTEITDFLQNNLLVQVDEILAHSSVGDTKDLKKELENLENTLRSAGIDPDTTPKVIELRTQYQSAGSPESLSNEVFSHLTSFFRRYYNQGDFISQRRYKNDVYAIPYEGEEVKLYWANYDQYYIKTGENFKNYTFKIDDGRIVHFRLRDANTEQNNNKALQGKERRFKLAEVDVLSIENNELSIWFTYEPEDKKDSQSDLNRVSFATITPILPIPFKGGLQKLLPTKSNPSRTLLEKHLNDYTVRNTSDYFIHKNLGGFLNRELDFYIKNEILHIDDINFDLPQVFDKQLRVIKALKSIAQKIIAMLAQIEDFQKKLWLKKKFVIQSDYCITLDLIPARFYPEILNNSEQINEWIRLFSINEIKADAATLPYTEPVTIDFLKANSFLLLDTRFFSLEWKYSLLATFENIDELCNGLLINSENFQALNLLQNRYKGQVRCTYIDPPYNAKSSEIIYKNTFKNSSFACFFENRVDISKYLLNDKGIINVAIDDYEFKRVNLILDNIFGQENFLSNVVVIHNPRGRNDDRFYGTSHEYMLVYALNKDLASINNFPLDEESIKQYNKEDDISAYAETSFMRTGNNSNKFERQNLHYPIYINPSTYEMRLEPFEDGVEVLPINSSGEEKTWRWERKTFLEKWKTELFVKNSDGELKVYKKRRITDAGKKPKTIWHNPKYDASSNGIMPLRSILGQSNLFSYPKAISTVADSVYVTGGRSALFLDYFAGSGTTAHAIINLNREDSGSRKYILIEMGEYFNPVTKKRVQRVIYSEDWKDGKPLSRKGSSHCFKYLRLESYEDSLNNLQLKRSGAQQSLLENAHFGEEYLLHYMLDVESRDSLLNAEMFKKPFGYTLKVTENNELKEQEVDLVETFNYLVGLIVESMQIIKGTVVVQGKNLQGEKILIIWRDISQTDNAALNEFFRKLNINTRDSEFKRIYVNGDNNLENLRTDDEQWKVVLIEEAFQKLMFEANEL